MCRGVRHLEDSRGMKGVEDVLLARDAVEVVVVP